jgi:O-antigen ligase
VFLEPEDMKTVGRVHSLPTVFFRFAILCFLFAPPFLPLLFDKLAAHDSQRILQLGIFSVAAACYLFKEKYKPLIPLTTPSKCLLLTLLSCAIISILLSPQPHAALRDSALMMGLLGFIATVGFTDFKNQYSFILQISVYSATVYSLIITSTMLMASLGGGHIQAAELFLGYDNFRFYNHAQTVCLPLLALVTASKCCSVQMTRLAWVGLVTGLTLLMVSAGRATATGLLLASVFSLFLFKSAARTFVWHLFLATLLGALLNFIIIMALPFIINGHAATFEIQNTQHARSMLTSSSRDYLWDLSLKYIMQYPWFGIGPMHFAHYPNAKAGHPHNIYLQVAAEWGIPILLSCLFITAYGLKRMMHAIRSCVDGSEKTIGIALFSACMAVMVDGAFSGNFVMPISQMWIAVLIGLSISWTRSQQATSEPTIPSQADIYISRSFKVLLLASQLWLIWSIYPELIHLHDHLEQVKTQLPQNLPNAPRFWSFGWF